jgi:hypothetical protein
VQRNINRRLKPALKIARTIPDDLLHGHPLAGGLSVPHLWDETNIEKLLILQASLMDKTLDIYQVMTGALLRTRQKCCSLNISISTPWNGLTSLDDGAWLTSLWQWLTAQSLTISVPLEPPRPLYEGDICIMDHYTSHQPSLLSPVDLALLKRHAQGQKVDITDALRCLIANMQSLQHHLLKEDIIWVSEMTEPRHCMQSVTNRMLKPEFSYLNNGNRKCEWVKTILGGTPGLFSCTLQCEFSLGPRTSVAEEETYWSPLENFDYYHGQSFSNLKGTDHDRQDFVKTHLDLDWPAMTSTDGSVLEGTGTYVYLLFNPHAPDETPASTLYGGGQEHQEWTPKRT